MHALAKFQLHMPKVQLYKIEETERSICTVGIWKINTGAC